MQVAAGDQFLHQQARHDGLARAGVVGEQEPQGLAGQHLFVHRGDLMRKRLKVRGMDGEVGVEEVGEADPQRFGGEPEERRIGVECPAALLDFDLQAGLVGAVKHLLVSAAFLGSVGERAGG